MMTEPNTPMDEFRGLHPADLADRLQRLSVPEAQAILRGLPTRQASAAMAELDEERARELLEDMSPEEIVSLFRELPSADAADLVGELASGRAQTILNRLPVELASRVTQLMRYPEDSAGGIMSDRFIALREDRTIGECLEQLRGRAERPAADEVTYLYVVDALGKLKGVVTLRDLIFGRTDWRIQQITNPAVRYLSVEADQEEIARQFRHYHYLGLPVVERTGQLVGVVRASDVIEVMQQEATEDMQLMVGLSGEERALTPWQSSLVKRLPWLLLNLATAFLAAAVVGFYEETIALVPVLAVFLPIVAGQGGNAGMQTLTVIVRDLALGEIAPGDGRRALAKELILGLLNGLAVGVVVGVVGYLWKGSVTIGCVVGVAMVLNMVSAGLSGVLIPMGLRAARVDPALASSIFLTTVTDVAGFFFFLGLATVAVRWIVA